MTRRLQTLAWDAGYVLRAILGAICWPFQRATWAIERTVVWPLRERAGGRGLSVRAASLVALGLLAVVAGVAVAAFSGSGERDVSASAPVSAPTALPSKPKPAREAAATEPVLEGVAPSFSTGPSEARSKGKDAAEAGAAIAAAPARSAQASARDVIASDPPAQSSDPPAAAAEAVHEFSSAFLLYEIGQSGDKVNSTLSASASPRLVHKLLSRPPRQPASVHVPKAKVLNVVSGPRHGKTYTFSVSLLRLGLTSELRLEVERDRGDWQVTNVIG